MVKNYVGALKKGDPGSIMGLVLLLVLVWFLYKYFTKKQEGMRGSVQTTSYEDPMLTLQSGTLR
jgi:hypothetical protein